ncbi:transcriptional regulator MntR [Bhargavaea beijingensis]|uniref:Manganese transport regulator n=1 Tax=Bhargavaea beijingensis TaxID=426756 RepID=A0A1G7FB28_9BACL|nr:transcriptional regulator MntR [Bhargavaea beijingensis]MCW1927702.1 transcriptional regulator MntR [Bhargavaea beijingensis]RSK33359.1 transcriptional regulator MntR [Bhargavaea beijingensis]SDE72705.1 iron (metal) dependent repressor, DtxR family [Bhargavaea beijingensis]
MATPSMEDYLEQIWLKSAVTGEARVSDVAEALEVLPSSVTKMARKLDREGYLVYERYKGLILTSKGEAFGRKLAGRHELLERFLRLIGVDEKHVYNDVEGIEHHLSWDAIDRITELVQVLEDHPAMLGQLMRQRTAGGGDEERER